MNRPWRVVASSDIQSKHGGFYGLYLGGWMFINGLIQQLAFLKVVLDTEMPILKCPAPKMTMQACKTLIDIPEDDAATYEGAARMIRNSYQTYYYLRTFDMIWESSKTAPLFFRPIVRSFDRSDVRSNIQCLDRLPHRKKTHMYFEIWSNQVKPGVFRG